MLDPRKRTLVVIKAMCMRHKVRLSGVKNVQSGKGGY